MARIILAIVAGIAYFTATAATFITFAGPYNRLMVALNSSMYGITGGSGADWNFWVSQMNFQYGLYGISAVLFTVGGIITVYLWATRKDVIAGAGFI